MNSLLFDNLENVFLTVYKSMICLHSDLVIFYFSNKHTLRPQTETQCNLSEKKQSYIFNTP